MEKNTWVQKSVNAKKRKFYQMPNKNQKWCSRNPFFMDYFSTSHEFIMCLKSWLVKVFNN